VCPPGLASLLRRPQHQAFLETSVKLLRARILVACASLLLISVDGHAQARQPDWKAIEAETMEHYLALLRMDTSDPPGREQPAVDYLRAVLEKEGIPVETFTLEPGRPNLVARLKGNGSKRPILIMGHTDVVNVDPAKWTYPPFSATRANGYVYGRGTRDDKDNVVAGLMILLTIKRLGIPLDRDVIFLAEAGEEGSTRVGIQFMVNQHFSKIDAEYCLAEAGPVARVGGVLKYAGILTSEKIPRAVELTARGIAGHGSVPLQSNAITHLARAIRALTDWQPPIELNETTRAYFKRLATISAPADAARYLDIVSGDSARVRKADEYFRANEPSHASMIRTSISPTMLAAGYRVNVIPAEAKATLDIRMIPSDDPIALLARLSEIIADPAVTIAWAARDVRPSHEPSAINNEAFRVLEENVTRHYGVVTLPYFIPGASDMAYLRARGIQCYGIDPAADVEEPQRGFGPHSDQERVLESDLHKFVRFHYDVVERLAKRN